MKLIPTKRLITKTNSNRAGKIIIGAGIILFLIGCGAGNSQKTNNEKKGTSAAQTGTSGAYQVTLIEIGSVNCVPCRMMTPILDDVKEEYKGVVRVVFYDVFTPQGKRDAAPFRIRVIPTQVFLDKDGKEYFRHEGFFPKDKVVQKLEEQIK